MSLEEIRQTVSEMGEAEQTSFRYQTCPESGVILHPSMSHSYRLLIEGESPIPISDNRGKIKIPGHDDLFFNYSFIRSAALLAQMGDPEKTVLSFSINKQLAELTYQIGCGMETDFASKMMHLTQIKTSKNDLDIFATEPERSRWLAFDNGEKRIFDEVRHGLINFIYFSY